MISVLHRQINITSLEARTALYSRGFPVIILRAGRHICKLVMVSGYLHMDLSGLDCVIISGKPDYNVTIFVTALMFIPFGNFLYNSTFQYRDINKVYTTHGTWNISMWECCGSQLYSEFCAK